MRTIPRRQPRRPQSRMNKRCQYCWALFPIHRLVRLRNGLLACVDNDAIGRDEVTLDEANAAASGYYANYSDRNENDA